MDYLVSIIVTCFNQDKSIEKALLSVLNQTYKKIELIVVDDCSVDKSREIIQPLQREYSNRDFKYFFFEKNVGVSSARNHGFKSANGDFITYLDGDDLFFHNKIEKEINTFKKDPTAEIIYSNFYFEDQNTSRRKIWLDPSSDKIHQGFILEEVLTRNFPKETLFRNELIKKTTLQKINFLDEKLIAFEDWDMRIRYSKFSKIKFSGNVGSVYVLNSQSITHTLKSEILIGEYCKVYFKNRLSLSGLKNLQKSIRLMDSKIYPIYVGSAIRCNKFNLVFIIKFLLRNEFVTWRYLVEGIKRKIISAMK